MRNDIIFFPWYELEDFQQYLCTRDGDDPKITYEDWLRAAAVKVMRILADGHPVQIVRVRPEQYAAWHRARGLPDTQGERRAYLAQVCSASGCAMDRVEPESVWERAATRH